MGEVFFHFASIFLFKIELPRHGNRTGSHSYTENFCFLWCASNSIFAKRTLQSVFLRGNTFRLLYCLLRNALPHFAVIIINSSHSSPILFVCFDCLCSYVDLCRKKKTFLKKQNEKKEKLLLSDIQFRLPN